MHRFVDFARELGSGRSQTCDIKRRTADESENMPQSKHSERVQFNALPDAVKGLITYPVSLRKLRCVLCKMQRRILYEAKQIIAGV